MEMAQRIWRREPPFFGAFIIFCVELLNSECVVTVITAVVYT